jgi:hypothetical protein
MPFGPDHDMNPILNRDFEHPQDGWYMIEPKGEHPNVNAGVVQVIDDEAAQNIVIQFTADAQSGRLSHGSEMLVDHEHFKHDPTQETRAYGWLHKLQNREDGIFGMIRWTGIGQKAVDGGEYRFFSTEYDPKDVVILNSGNPRSIRPLRLDGLTLTNQPNNKGGSPITNRSYGPAISKAPARSELAPEFQAEKSTHISTPALDAWFGAIAKVKTASHQLAAQPITFSHAWSLARRTFPKEYADAFGAENQTLAGSPDTRAAGAVVGEIANRIRLASGADFRFGWKFVAENLPGIFNRMLPTSAPVLNRSTGNENAEFFQKKAAKLFNRLVGQEKALTGGSLTLIWNRMSHEEPALHGLASGQITAEQAFSTEPNLQCRLINL